MTAFAGYEVAWRSCRAATTAPANNDLRNEVERHYGDPFLTVLFSTLDRLAADSLATSTEEQSKSSVTLQAVEAVGEDGSSASIVVCEVLLDPVVNVSSGAIVFDSDIAYSSRVTLSRESGVWTVVEEVVVGEKGGSACS